MTVVNQHRCPLDGSPIICSDPLFTNLECGLAASRGIKSNSNRGLMIKIRGEHDNGLKHQEQRLDNQDVILPKTFEILDTL